MKYSIKQKLFLIFSCLILVFVIISWLLNILLLDRYYHLKKMKSLVESYKSINEKYKGDTDEISLELENLQQNKGINIVIVDKDFKTKFDSVFKRSDEQSRAQERNTSQKVDGAPERTSRGPSHPEMMLKSKAEQMAKVAYIIEDRKDERLGTGFINLFSKLGNDDYILMNTPIQAIRESADIANRFSLFTGILTIIAGSVIIFIVAGRFSRPILELNGIAQKMSTLDFSRRYTVKSRDEIGQLGQSINSLSEQLQKSIFELKEANQLLKEDIKKKKEVDEMRKEFISSVSHELKTPLALVQGYAEGLKLNVNEDEENKNYYCEVIIDEAAKMNRLVKQLLELAQIESGQSSNDREEFMIRGLVEGVLKKNELLFKNIEVRPVLKVSPEAADAVVDADYYKIEQVLINYINNAIHHVDGKKQIKVSIVRTVGEKVRISVFNSGKNIPEESLEKIWVSFYKVDKARTRAYGGTGLGLSIVRAIMEANGGACGVENVEDGVEFWFEL